MHRLQQAPSLRLVPHAKARCQQRGCDLTGLSTIIRHGRRYHAGEGRKAYFLGRRDIARAMHHHGVDLSRWIDMAVIVQDGTKVITVQHVKRPKRSWRGRH